MNTLWDMMMEAQGGDAMQDLARQFSLAPDQARSAVEALLPAFQMGLQNNSQSIGGFEDMMRLLGGGQFVGFHDADAGGDPGEAARRGDDVLGQLFGGEEVSRAVAAQASAMSGVSDAVIRQMLPVVASLVMSGLFKGAMNNGLGGLMGQIMSGHRPAPPKAQNPMGDMIGQFLGGMMGAKPAPPPPTPMSAGMDMLRSMFDSGQQAQRAQMDAFQAIFDRFSRRG